MIHVTVKKCIWFYYHVNEETWRKGSWGPGCFQIWSLIGRPWLWCGCRSSAWNVQSFMFLIICFADTLRTSCVNTWSSCLPVVGGQQDGPGQSLSWFGEQRRLKQTPDLKPAGQRFAGSCGEPHCRPADTERRSLTACVCVVNTMNQWKRSVVSNRIEVCFSLGSQIGHVEPEGESMNQPGLQQREHEGDLHSGSEFHSLFKKFSSFWQISSIVLWVVERSHEC